MKFAFKFVSWTAWIIVWVAIGSFLVMGIDRAAHAVQKTCSLKFTDPTLPSGAKPILGHKVYHSTNASSVNTMTGVDVPLTATSGQKIQLFAVGIETPGDHFVKVTAYNADGETDKSAQIVVTIDGVVVPPPIVLPGIPSATVECP